MAEMIVLPPANKGADLRQSTQSNKPDLLGPPRPLSRAERKKAQIRDRQDAARQERESDPMASHVRRPAEPPERMQERAEKVKGYRQSHATNQLKDLIGA
jgi:hypothetical protein